MPASYHTTVWAMLMHWRHEEGVRTYRHESHGLVHSFAKDLSRCHGVPNRRQLDCLLYSLFGLTTKPIAASHCWGESTSGRCIPLTIESLMCKVYPCHNIIIAHTIKNTIFPFVYFDYNRINHVINLPLIGLTLISVWISNYIFSNEWDEITYPFPNFNGCTVEVWEWISNYIPHFMMDVIIYPCCDYPC